MYNSKSDATMRFIVLLLMNLVMIVLYGTVTMLLWNWLMPEIFGLIKLTWIQAFGLTLLIKCLFGNIVNFNNKN